MEDFKVLVVDDEEDFVKTLSERLEMRDLKPDVAMNGEQALEKEPRKTRRKPGK
jgi:CheY-like chemotaxis protein